MIEATVDITTADGPMETFLCSPERGGAYPAVFFLMDAHGIRDELRDMARRLATVGCTHAKHLRALAICVGRLCASRVFRYR
jgi:dienelactone hydrolase